MISVAGRRQGQNPRHSGRLYVHPEQKKETPEEPDSSEPQERARRLIARMPFQAGKTPKGANRRRALSSPEASPTP